MRAGLIDGYINDLYEVIYDSGELAAAVSSLDITNINGDNDEEYILISRFKNDYNGSTYYRLRINNDDGTNYGYQQLDASDTTVSATRDVTDCVLIGGANSLSQLSFGKINLSVKSGNVRILMSQSAWRIALTTVNKIFIIGNSWNNTVNNVTSLKIYSDETNAIGVGSRIILLKKIKTTKMDTGSLIINGNIKNTWQKIYENDIESATQEVTIPSLNGNLDVLYNLVCRFKNGNPDYTTWWGLRLNSDSGSNYGIQSIKGNNTDPSAQRYIDQDTLYLTYTATALGSLSMINALLYAKSGFVRTMINSATSGILGTTIAEIRLHGQVWNNTVDNITSMIIRSSQPEGIGVGSHIELWALKLN